MCWQESRQDFSQSEHLASTKKHLKVVSFDFLMQRIWIFFCSTPGCVYKMLMIRNQRHYVKRFTFVSPSAVFSCSSYLLLLPRLCRREAKLEHFFTLALLLQLNHCLWTLWKWFFFNLTRRLIFFLFQLLLRFNVVKLNQFHVTW